VHLAIENPTKSSKPKVFTTVFNYNYTTIASTAGNVLIPLAAVRRS
jgi:hypothetical protein